MNIQQIFAPIQEELVQVEARLRQAVRVEYLPLADIFEMLIGSGGKRIRPALAILAAKFHPTDPEKNVYAGDGCRTCACRHPDSRRLD